MTDAVNAMMNIVAPNGAGQNTMTAMNPVSGLAGLDSTMFSQFLAGQGVPEQIMVSGKAEFIQAQAAMMHSGNLEQLSPAMMDLTGQSNIFASLNAAVSSGDMATARGQIEALFTSPSVTPVRDTAMNPGAMGAHPMQGALMETMASFGADKPHMLPQIDFETAFNSLGAQITDELGLNSDFAPVFSDFSDFADFMEEQFQDMAITPAMLINAKMSAPAVAIPAMSFDGSSDTLSALPLTSGILNQGSINLLPSITVDPALTNADLTNGESILGGQAHTIDGAAIIAPVKKIMPAKVAKAMQAPQADVPVSSQANMASQTVGDIYSFKAGLQNTIAAMQTSSPAMALMNTPAQASGFADAMKALGLQSNSASSMIDDLGDLRLMAGDFANSGQFGGSREQMGQSGQQTPWTMPAMMQGMKSPTQTMNAFSWQGSESWSQFSDTLTLDLDGALATVASGLSGMTGDKAVSPLMPASSSLAQQMMAQQASDQLGMNIKKFSADGLDKFTVNLKPADLGTVKVSMTFAADGKVQATILAERPETLDLLKLENRSIERAMAEAGHRLDKLSISYDLDQESGSKTGKAWADSMVDDWLEDTRNKEYAQNGHDENPVNWTAEEEISLDDILAHVTVDTGLDIRV